MAGTNRAATSGLELLADLRDNATRYDFFQAIRLLENLHPDRPPMGSSQKAIDDPVRLGQEPSLAFAPSTLAEFNHSTPGAKPRLNVRFFGLFGPNGPLPLHLTEYARDRIRNHKDLTLTRFLDVFHHRLLSLFYRAWSDVQPVVQLERGEYDRFSCYVASLFGCGTEDYLDRDALPQRAKLYHAGHLATQTRHAEGLRSILADYFQLPVQIEEFIGQWVELPDNCRCTIGGLGQTASLGRAATIGSHIWDCQQKFRITIGPVSWDDYQRR
ncbi:MAG: type VI secretion system baseplate subunit TssG, partial [Planctomycetales bacterium]|nr:type VI secretion system baseplate subunit TssG [Planctomycetales bacterium]